MKRIVSGLAALTLPLGLMLVVAPADAAAKYTVSISAGAGRADVGHTVTLRGRVSPNAKGQRVLVQQLNGSTWTTVKRPMLNRLSKYAVSVKVTKGGDNKYRVVKPRTNGHPKGTSATVTITGWRWRSLAGMPVYQVANTTVLDSGMLGPVSYSPFIKIGSPVATFGYMIYLLDGKCARFDAHVGVTADSGSTDLQHALLARSTTAAPLDFQPISESYVFRGQDPVHYVRGPDVMSNIAALQVYANVSAGSYVAWGGAKLYCRS